MDKSEFILSSLELVYGALQGTVIGNIKIIADTTLDNEYNDQQFSCVIGHYNCSH